MGGLSVNEILFVQGFCPFSALLLAFYYFSISLETIACMLFLLFQQALIIECDEMWSFVSSKANKLYIWLAIDRVTREVIGCYIGDRTRCSALLFPLSMNLGKKPALTKFA